MIVGRIGDLVLVCPTTERERIVKWFSATHAQFTEGSCGRRDIAMFYGKEAATKLRTYTDAQTSRSPASDAGMAGAAAGDEGRATQPLPSVVSP